MSDESKIIILVLHFASKDVYLFLEIDDDKNDAEIWLFSASASELSNRRPNQDDGPSNLLIGNSPSKADANVSNGQRFVSRICLFTCLLMLIMWIAI